MISLVEDGKSLAARELQVHIEKRSKVKLEVARGEVSEDLTPVRIGLSLNQEAEASPQAPDSKGLRR